MGNDNNKIKSKDVFEINKRWKMFRDHQLGRGAFGEVYKGQDNKSGEIVAVKRMWIDPNLAIISPGLAEMFNQDRITKEVQLMLNMKGFEHDNIVKFYDFVFQKPTVYLILELCDEDLKKYIAKKGGRLSESDALHIGRQIVEGLRALHTMGISHRDLKFDNILIKNGVCKISDLGMGIDKEKHRSTVGAVFLRPPEAIKK